MFKVDPTNVAAQLVQVVVSVIVSCFQARPVVYVDVSTLSVLRLEKFVFITLRLAEIASQDAIVVIELILFN